MAIADAVRQIGVTRFSDMLLRPTRELVLKA